MNYSVAKLPIKQDVETKAILKQLVQSHRYLAELKGVAATIPNETILINSLVLQEAKDSSAVENIITTHDEMFKAQLFENYIANAAAKEVSNYSKALQQGFRLVRNKKFITNNHILEIQKVLEQNDAGYRRLPGTILLNQSTGETVFTPPQNYDEITSLMDNLIIFMNDDKMMPVDPLIKMAIIHHQFESIHPFYDGNGRTGRIINILYLVIKELLDLPILYLSRYIIRTKPDYYLLLQKVRENGQWENWILYILKGIENTAKETIFLIQEMRNLMMDYKHRIRKELPKIYSQDLLNNLFRHPYTKIDFVMRELTVSRLTARRYLHLLVDKKFLEKEKIGKSNFYVNVALFRLFKGESIEMQETPPIITKNPDHT